jgi:hypothetical protein
MNGKDLRSLARLARLLAGSTSGIVFNEHTDEDRAIVFQHACRFGFERPSRDWLKIKNPAADARIGITVIADLMLAST